jgi:hypothetical protein
LVMRGWALRPFRLRLRRPSHRATPSYVETAMIVFVWDSLSSLTSFAFAWQGADDAAVFQACSSTSRDRATTHHSVSAFLAKSYPVMLTPRGFSSASHLDSSNLIL